MVSTSRFQYVASREIDTLQYFRDPFDKLFNHIDQGLKGLLVMDCNLGFLITIECFKNVRKVNNLR